MSFDGASVHAMSASGGVRELPTVIEEAPRPADLWRRLLARAADAATVLMVLWVLVVLQIFWFMDEATARVDPQPWGESFLPLAIFVALSATYEVVFLRFNDGQTPGKDLFNVRVVRRVDEPTLSLPRAALRWVLPGAAMLVWPLWLGAALLLATGITTLVGPRRALHDLLAGTEVIRYRHKDQIDDDDEPDEPDDPRDDLPPPGTTSSTMAMEMMLGRRRRAGRR